MLQQNHNKNLHNDDHSQYYEECQHLLFNNVNCPSNNNNQVRNSSYKKLRSNQNMKSFSLSLSTHTTNTAPEAIEEENNPAFNAQGLKKHYLNAGTADIHQLEKKRKYLTNNINIKYNANPATKYLLERYNRILSTMSNYQNKANIKK